MLPEYLIIGVFGIYRNFPREQSLAFLTDSATEMFARFATDRVHQRTKSPQWARRFYSHKLESCESLRAAVITSLRPFRNKLVELEEGQVLMDLN
jgi:hypothetical protein